MESRFFQISPVLQPQESLFSRLPGELFLIIQNNLDAVYARALLENLGSWTIPGSADNKNKLLCFLTDRENLPDADLQMLCHLQYTFKTNAFNLLNLLCYYGAAGHMALLEKRLPQQEKADDGVNFYRNVRLAVQNEHPHILTWFIHRSRYRPHPEFDKPLYILNRLFQSDVAIDPAFLKPIFDLFPDETVEKCRLLAAEQALALQEKSAKRKAISLHVSEFLKRRKYALPEEAFGEGNVDSLRDDATVLPMEPAFFTDRMDIDKVDYPGRNC